MLVCLQIVVGRSGTEMLTNEAGEVTRCLFYSLTLQFSSFFFFMTLTHISFGICCLSFFPSFLFFFSSHLQGMFSRTIRLLESGLKPVYFFYCLTLFFVHFIYK